MPLNLVNTITITAKTNLANLTTASTNVLTNTVSGGAIYKINTIMISNYSPIYHSANLTFVRDGVGEFYMANNIIVPGQSLLTLVGKDSQIYLEEGDRLTSSVDANSVMHMVIGYEILS